MVLKRKAVSMAIDPCAGCRSGGREQNGKSLRVVVLCTGGRVCVCVCVCVCECVCVCVCACLVSGFSLRLK